MLRHVFIGEIQGRVEDWRVQTNPENPHSMLGGNLFGNLNGKGAVCVGIIHGRTADSKYIINKTGSFYELGSPSQEFAKAHPNFMSTAVASLPVFEIPTPEPAVPEIT